MPKWEVSDTAEKTTLTSTTTYIHHHLSDSLNLLARDSFILNMFAIEKDSERGDTYPQVSAGANEENIVISSCILRKASGHVTK